MMLKKTFLFLNICAGLNSTAIAQLANAGQMLFIGQNAVVFVAEDYKHLSGTILNNGNLIVDGDWYNEHQAGKVFNPVSVGKVTFAGAGQKIAGASVTSFPGLELSGSGAKSVQVNAEVFGVLNLNDREMLLNQNSLLVNNLAQPAIIRSSGFINTDAGGKLIRATNTTGAYLFPLGSSAANRYRPVVIEPQNAAPCVFAATLFNNNPDNNGYNRNSRRQDVENVFDKYFFVIDQPEGTTNATLKFFLNSSDGDFKQLVNWGAFRLWEKAAPSTFADGNFDDGLTRYLSFSSTRPISNLPFTFASVGVFNDPLTFFNAFSPDGDGKNDKWLIKNLELFPDNDLTIFNRWGDEVFKSKSYSDVKAWDGGNLNPGTYFYLLKVTINGAQKTYKGFITMLKKD